MVMEIQCPKCGELILLNSFGRKPLNITVKNVCDALQKHHNITAAAEELGCSRAYIYRVLKKNNLSLGDFVDPGRRRKSKKKQN